MTAAPTPEDFFRPLCWLNGKPLLETIEPYRRRILAEALYSFDDDGWPRYNRVLSGRAKKNFKTADLTLAALYRFLAWPSVAGNDCFIIANDEEQAGDDLALAKKLIAANPDLDAEVTVYAKEITRNDGLGRLTILPARDVLGLHGKTFLFLGLDEIHGYRNYDVFEALSPDPSRLDVLTWITSYSGIRHAPGIPIHDLLRIGKAGDDPRMFFSWYAADYTTDAALAGDGVTPEQRANPSMAAWGNDKYLTDQKRRLPTHKYRRLHLNLPGAPDGAAFDPDTVTEAIVTGRKQLPPDQACQYYGFVDMSGGSADDAVLGIAHGEDGKIILDALVSQTGTAPFNPRLAVRKFADLLREYGLHRVTGDRFAGETFRKDFQDEGIFYDVSLLSRSQIYEAFEPKLNAGLLALLDLPKLQEQLLTLVVKGSGRIDHQSGDHDDWANAACGAIVCVATTSGPALVRPDALLEDGAPLPVPTRCDLLAAILCADARGQCAVVYLSKDQYTRPPLRVLDFHVQSLAADLFAGIGRQFAELEQKCRPRSPRTVLYTTEALLHHAQSAGFDAELIPPGIWRDDAKLAQSASGHVTAGRVRLAQPAYEHGLTAPLAGAMNMRPGETVGENSLRAALLASIALALDVQQVWNS